jgi:hypothetical protein
MDDHRAARRRQTDAKRPQLRHRPRALRNT